jgi:hypothetical protein
MTSVRRALARGLAALLVAGSLAGGVSAVAQGIDKYSARLGWVPTAGADRVAGKGAATASLAGRALTITGSFEGLGGPATVARLHEGIAKGARGRAVGDLTITKATSGTIGGSITLTTDQVEALKQGRLYIQVHGDKGLAPDGANLWGWLLK